MYQATPSYRPFEPLLRWATQAPAHEAVLGMPTQKGPALPTYTATFSSSSVQELRRVAPIQDGLQTPPPDMPTTKPDSIRLPTFPQKFEDHMTAQSQATGEPLYQPNPSNMVSLLHYPKDRIKVQSRPHSPNVKSSTSSFPSQHRRQSSSNAIALNMQIPPTINDSQGSLAEFAAQITDLFWFESSKTLQRVEESKMAPAAIAPLVPDAIPTLGFRKWVTTILATTQVTPNVVLLALMFVYRLKKMNHTVKGKPGSEYRLLTVALMLGNKFLDDNTYTNKTWAEVSGISVQEIHIMEVEFLSNMRYSLFTSEVEWKEWHVKLGKFWDYFNKASQQAAENSTAQSLGSSSLLSVPTLPSPPSSTHASPPFIPACSPGNAGYPHPLSMPPQLTAYIRSPNEQNLEHNWSSRARKRSLDENAFEPPSKRVSRAMAPLPNNFPLHSRPSHAAHTLQSGPQLPIPNLTISTSQPQLSSGSQSVAHLPSLGGRSMATVYPLASPANWSQQSSVGTPMSSGSSAQTFALTPLTDQSRKPSPYHMNPDVSPTSTGYSVSAGPHSHPSPSYFLTQRSSPYRPVRKVSTLLVPPPSSSMNSHGLSLDLNAMHYHPLGRPRNECKSGVVPYLNQESWHQPQQQHIQAWSSVPQPSYNG